MFSKSEGLQVNKGRSLAIAVAAIIASNARALDLRPPRRRDAATRPNERAAAASKGSGRKSASACWRRNCRTACSWGFAATSGPTDSSASVTAVIIGSPGNDNTSVILSRRMTVLVSRTPRGTAPAVLTRSDQESSQCRDAVSRGPLVEVFPNDSRAPSPTTEAVRGAAAWPRVCRLESLSGARLRTPDRRPGRHDFVIHG